MRRTYCRLMELSRRALLTSASLALPAVALGNQVPAAAKPRKAHAATAATLGAFHSFMAENRFTPLPPLPLCPAHATTAGYNYDEGMTRSDWRNGRYVVQTCARVDDIPKRRKRGVLPAFNIGAWQTTPSKALPLAIAFLVDVMGLRPENLTVTTIKGNPLLAYITKAGLKRSQVELRDTAAAKSAGDGSGWFVDPVTGQGNPSMSIEYRRGSRTLEIGETGICMGLPGKPAHVDIGIERVTWAAAGHIEPWEDVLPRLLSYSSQVSQNAGIPLPAGYETFRAGL